MSRKEIDAVLASKNYFDALGVSKDSSKEDIKRAFYRLSLLIHPDKNPNKIVGDTINANATEAFKKISEAYTTLKDDELKIKYLAEISRAPQASSAPSSEAAPRQEHFNEKQKKALLEESRKILAETRITNTVTKTLDLLSRIDKYLNQGHIGKREENIHKITERIKKDTDILDAVKIRYVEETDEERKGALNSYIESLDEHITNLKKEIDGLRSDINLNPNELKAIELKKNIITAFDNAIGLDDSEVKVTIKKDSLFLYLEARLRSFEDNFQGIESKQTTPDPSTHTFR